jgi:hypothetical protein
MAATNGELCYLGFAAATSGVNRRPVSESAAKLLVEHG